MNAETMFLVVGIGYAVFGVMLALVQRQELPEDRLRHLAAGFLLLGVGTFLQAGRDVLPLIVALWLGNLLSTFGLLMQWWGVKALTGHPPQRRERAAGTAVLLMSLVTALLLQEPARVIFGSATYAIWFLLPAWSLARWAAGNVWLRYLVSGALVVTSSVFAALHRGP